MTPGDFAALRPGDRVLAPSRYDGQRRALAMIRRIDVEGGRAWLDGEGEQYVKRESLDAWHEHPSPPTSTRIDIEAYREAHGVNPSVEIRTEAWLNLAVVGLVAGRAYMHDGRRLPRWIPRRVFNAAARFIIGRLFREVAR